MTTDGVHIAAVRFYERLAAFSRFVLSDRRGTGMTDPTSMRTELLDPWAVRH